MDFLAIIALLVVVSFGFVIFFGAPYLPTLNPQITTSFELLNLKRGQQLLELGCGDGRILVKADQLGLKACGYELNPILFLIAWLRTKKYKNITVIWGNYLTTPLPKSDGIFIFGLDRVMSKLDKKIVQEFSHPVKLVSYNFKIPGKKPTKQKGNVYLYEY